MLWAAQNRKCTERTIIAGKFVCLFVFDAAQGGKSNKALVLPPYSSLLSTRRIHMFHPSDFQSLEDKKEQRARNFFWLGYFLAILVAAAGAVVAWLL